MFPVNLKWFWVLVLRPAATQDCRVTHGINPEYRKTFFGNQFSTFASPRDFPQRIQSDGVQRNREAVPSDLQSKVKTSLTSKDGQNYGTIPMPMFASRPLTTSCTTSGGLPAETRGRRAKTLNFGITTRQIPLSIIILGVENKIQNTGLKWFWFCVGSYVMDQRSGEGWFLGWANIFTVSFWNVFANFEMLDAKNASALNKITQKSQFKKRRLAWRGAESPKSGPVSERETKSPPWSTTIFEWLVLMTEYWIMLISSLLLSVMTTFRNSTRDGTKFFYRCQNFHPMKSWKVCTNWRYVSLTNSKPY